MMSAHDSTVIQRERQKAELKLDKFQRLSLLGRIKALVV